MRRPRLSVSKILVDLHSAGSANSNSKVLVLDSHNRVLGSASALRITTILSNLVDSAHRVLVRQQRRRGLARLALVLPPHLPSDNLRLLPRVVVFLDHLRQPQHLVKHLHLGRNQAAVFSVVVLQPLHLVSPLRPVAGFLEAEHLLQHLDKALLAPAGFSPPLPQRVHSAKLQVYSVVLQLQPPRLAPHPRLGSLVSPSSSSNNCNSSKLVQRLLRTVRHRSKMVITLLRFTQSRPCHSTKRNLSRNLDWKTI